LAWDPAGALAIAEQVVAPACAETGAAAVTADG
jgi:hypothetical protein